MKISIFRIFLILTLLVVNNLAVSTSCVWAQNTDGDFLLTENGIANSQYSNYKKTPVLKTEGTYYATPAFDKAIAELGENGTETNPTSFSRGILTNGDASTDYKRRPMPYAYWHQVQKGILFFDLKKDYYISKVRVRMLLAPQIHGASKIGIYTFHDMLEAGSRPMQEVVPQNGWNEFVIDKASNVVKLDFTGQTGCPYITISEVEIWGRDTATQTNNPLPKTSRNYLAFDFGPEGSPVFEDFTPVNSSMVYDKKKGYGWIPFGKYGSVVPEQASHYGVGSAAVPGLLERDRGREVRDHDALFRDFCGAQIAYHPQLTQQFAVDLKPGKYRVFLTTGDIAYGKEGSDAVIVEAEGKRVVDGVKYGKDFTAKMQFDVTMTDGQLNLILSSEDTRPLASWSISSLCIFPVNTAIEEAFVQNIVEHIEVETQAQRKANFDALYKKVERIETNKLFALTQAQKDKGYLLFARDWMKMIYPNTIPLKSEVDNLNLSLACAPGEYEPATLGVYPLAKDLKATVSVSDLRNDQNVISQNNISVHLIGYLNERMKDETKTAGDDTYYVPNNSWADTYMEKVPKVLLPGNGTISIDETKQIWLTVQVPTDTKPGQYKGTLAFTPENHPQQTVGITLTVYPIQLLKSDRLHGMYWNDTPLYPQNRQKELANMQRHGIRSVVLGAPTNPDLKKSDDKLVVDFTRMDTLVKEIQNAGMTGPLPLFTDLLEREIKLFLRTNPDIKMTEDEAYQFVIAQIYQHSQEKHWPEILFNPVDEIGHIPARRAKLKHLGALIRAANKNAKIYVTVNNYASGVECADFIDISSVNIPLSKEQEQAILQSGKEYMRYGNSYNYNPRISRTVSGFGFWRIPATAMYYWHYQSPNGDPFNALDTLARDWMSTYPSPDGPLDTIDYEAIREGIDDLNYLHTMQTLMQKATQARVADVAVKEGQAILDEITNSDPAYSQYDFAGVPNEKYHEWRSRMAGVIEKLQDSMK